MGIRAALAVHGGSGHGAGGRHAAEVTARLYAAVDHLEVIEASTAEESQARMAAARDRGLDVLVVLGGDGSVHLGLQVCAGTETALGVIPAGTGNDLVRALGAPMSTLPATDVLVSALREGRRRRLDLGRIDGSRWFATVLCAGFDSLVNERANRMRWPHGPRRYDLAIIAELAALRPYPLVVETTGERLELEAVMVSVGNTPTYGGGIPICPEADTADGLFDVTVIGKAGRLELIRMIPTVRRGRHVGHPVVTTLRAKRVRIGDDNGWIAYADGDRMGPLPMEITCEPGAVTVVG